jgi:hypothetical protein
MSKHIEYDVTPSDTLDVSGEPQEIDLGNYAEASGQIPHGMDNQQPNGDEEGLIMVKPLVPPYGVLMLNLPKEVTDDLNSFIQGKIEDGFDGMEPMNSELAGHIKNEYRMPQFMKEKIEPIAFQLCGHHMNAFPYGTKQLNMLSGVANSIDDSNDPSQINEALKDVRLSLDTYWVNLQKKHEFNPLHNHSGLFSFVIWLKVPYKHQDELDYWTKNGTPSLDAAGTFCFVSPGVDGNLMQDYIPVDESYEGKMVLFPAGLGHMVYPFVTSDDYRISLSGNIMMGKNNS